MDKPKEATRLVLILQREADRIEHMLRLLALRVLDDGEEALVRHLRVMAMQLHDAFDMLDLLRKD